MWFTVYVLVLFFLYSPVLFFVGYIALAKYSIWGAVMSKPQGKTRPKVRSQPRAPGLWPLPRNTLASALRFWPRPRIQI